ncbi:MAG: hypothetical protein ACOCUT_03425 [bacterium]
MKEDRTAIYKIISDMLDNPDKYGIYPTSTAYTRLEHYIEKVRTKVRAEAIGWAHGFCCIELDKGNDPRTIEVPKIYEQAKLDLD